MGERLYQRLPSYLKAFDTCILPYRLDSFNLSCSPLKLYEYLAAGSGPREFVGAAGGNHYQDSWAGTGRADWGDSLKILFVHQELQSFVQKDLDILRSAHDVRTIEFTGRRGLVKHLVPDVWQLWQGVTWCDLSFTWFGSLPAFFTVLFSSLLGRKSVVVAGGWDVGQPPDGLPFQPFKRWCPEYVFRHADLSLPVSDFNAHEMRQYLRGPFKRVDRIYHGFDAEEFYPIEGIREERTVLTVGTVMKDSIVRKGLRMFVQTAALLPDISFWLIGSGQDETLMKQLYEMAPSNVEFTGWVSKGELQRRFSRARVVVQASTHEAFGCSVAEAMLCECIPVVSRQAALPEVVGDCGIYLDELTPSELAKRIQEAQNRSELGKMARERVVRLFPLQRRAQELLRAIEEVGAK